MQNFLYKYKGISDKSKGRGIISNWSNGSVSITLTDGRQRTPKRVGISYDYMDKLNTLVKQGIFVDKDKNGFTKAEQKALGNEFAKLHKERGDLLDFKKMLAGKTIDYKDAEFVRLAKAAGYVLAQETSETEKPEEKTVEKQTKTESVKPEVEKQKTQETAPKSQTSVSNTKETTEEEHAVLYKELQQMKTEWSEDERKHPEEKLRNLKFKISSEISNLQKPYTVETVKRKRFLRKDIEETVKKPKTEEQLAADKIKIEQKTAELNRIAKMQAVEELYSSVYPSKFAPGKDDKFLNSVITTKDGRKLGAATVKKTVYNSELKYNEEVWVTEYYPLSIKQHQKNNNSDLPSYYYGVDKNAKPVEGRIELTDGKVVQE